nr:helix-turn-helix transcriptional regulator [Bacillus safensis]
MTQSELAEGICSVSHLSKIENGSKEVPIKIRSICCLNGLASAKRRCHKRRVICCHSWMSFK